MTVDRLLLHSTVSLARGLSDSVELDRPGEVALLPALPVQAKRAYLQAPHHITQSAKRGQRERERERERERARARKRARESAKRGQRTARRFTKVAHVTYEFAPHEVVREVHCEARRRLEVPLPLRRLPR